MSTQLFIALTVIECVVLVAGLALFVIALTRRLRSVANALQHLSDGSIGAIHGKVCLVGAGAAILNRQLDAIAAMLPAVAEKAESLPSQQTASHTSGSSWRPATGGQDPVIRR
jgi:hypothetical protein